MKLIQKLSIYLFKRLLIVFNKRTNNYYIFKLVTTFINELN